MAKQTINLGTGPNTLDGDKVRTAFSKVNDNFDELYGLVGESTSGLVDLVVDSVANALASGDHISIDVIYSDDQDRLSLQANLSAVNQNIVPDTDVTYDLGSPTNQWRSLYVSGNTIYLGGTALSVSGTNITVDGEPISSTINYADIPDTPELAAVATSGSYTDLTDQPSIPADISDLTDTEGLLGQGSGTGIANGFTSVTIPVESGDVVIDLDDNNSVFTFKVNGTLELPDGGTISEDIVTDNPTINLTPANPDVESQKLVIKGGVAGFSNEENGIVITTYNLTVSPGNTASFDVYASSYPGETFYWWVDSYSPGDKFSPDNGTITLDEFGYANFSFVVNDSSVLLRVYVSDTLYNAYANGKGAVSVTVNEGGGTNDLYHLHLTTGDLQETSVFLGTDNHNIRTRIDGSVDLTSHNYDSGDTYRLNFKNNILKIASTANEGDEDLYIKAEDDLYLDAEDDDVFIRANDDVRIRTGFNFDEDTYGREWRFTDDGAIVFYNSNNGTDYGYIRQYDDVFDGARNLEVEGNQQINIKISSSNTTWKFKESGDLILPSGGDIVDSNGVGQTANRVEGSWTVTPGTGTYSFTVDWNNTYVMWVRGNIPNGIIVWNATVSVTNENVPVIGQQYAWNYTGGGSPLLLTSIPNQIVGTAGIISTDNSYIGNTGNTFVFGISNTSGIDQTVQWGYVKI